MEDHSFWASISSSQSLLGFLRFAMTGPRKASSTALSQVHRPATNLTEAGYACQQGMRGRQFWGGDKIAAYMKKTEMNEWTAATIGTVGEFIGVIEK
jgi:hypothetical protein